ncbi:MAG: shikimate dehydrogenase [Flavobacteriaceae bacterium]|nr:shikimate dehydrogenase [Flavobacteriaceae bacterium]
MDKNYEQRNQKVSFGLVGKNIPYSFSKKYFTEKFNRLNLSNHEFHNFDIDNLKKLPLIIKEYPNIKGLSVTIPYKEKIIELLDEISEEAREIGAVNCIKIINNKLIGYNTDSIGFENSFKQSLKSKHQKAIILGTGGASKAVKFVLNKLSISFISVSRNPKMDDEISYQSLSNDIIKEHQIIINCTPVGTFPLVDEFPIIPYESITDSHYLFDLIYNPSETLFLQKGKESGATIKNGLEMLEIQAEKAWEIWTSS